MLLLGLGHTNIQVVSRWRRGALPGVQLTCISNHDRATYSGLLPAVLAGTCERARMEIDLAAFCAASGARLVIDDVAGLDTRARRLVMRDGAALPFDVLSIGIGSVPTLDGVAVDDDSGIVPVKPMQTFIARLGASLRAAAHRSPGGAVRVVLVGGGAASAELALALPACAARECGASARLGQTIVNADPVLLPGCAASTRRRVVRALSRRGVEVVSGRRVVRVAARSVFLDDGGRLEGDVILWATGAAAPRVLATLGLPVDDSGFLLTHDTLQSTSGLPIFAVGDTGTIEGRPSPKAGVYAVRQGPVLWDNIGRLLAGRPLRRYVPQRDFLKLLNTGDGRAIAEWKGLSFEGTWCRHLKDAIDLRFMRRFA